MDRPLFNDKQEIIDKMIVMFGADIEDVLDGVLSNLNMTELIGVYDVMIIAYELGIEEA